MHYRSLRACLALGAALGLAALSPVPSPFGAVTCQATHEISCSGDGACASEASDTSYINLRYNPAQLGGDLCTSTYCRDFQLLPQPTAPGQTPTPNSGFVLSEHSGSTEEYQSRPIVDFQLSLNDERTQFVLMNVANGGAGGWAGRCEPHQP